MRARSVALLLAIMMTTPFVGRAQFAQAAKPSPFPVVQGQVYKFEKVAEGVYYATGGVGGNNTVIVNDNDVMLVDDGTTPATARALVQDIRLLTDKPIRYVVNTHFHYDHTNGNSVFPPEVQIIAHEYVRTAITPDVLQREPYKTSQGTRVPALIESLKKQIAEEKSPERKAALSKELADTQTFLQQLQEIRPTPPTVTYSSKLVFHKRAREIQLLFLGRGHTGGDTVVFLPAERIVITGDLMESQVAYMGDAFFDEWIATLQALKALDFTLVLPGHGAPFRDKGLITAFQNYITDLVNQVATLRKQGVSADDAAKRIDMTSHQEDFPQITGVGVEPRGIRRMYAWMDSGEHK